MVSHMKYFIKQKFNLKLLIIKMLVFNSIFKSHSFSFILVVQCIHFNKTPLSNLK